MGLFNSKIISINQLNSTVKLFKIKLENPIIFEPGQFGTCIFNIDDKDINRSYSFASISYDNVTEIEFCIRLNENGELTPKLFKLKEGFEFKFLGPMGKMVLDENLDSKKELIFLATGTGVAPFRSMVRKALENKNKVKLFFGCRNEGDILFRKEWEKLSVEDKKFEFNPVLSNSSVNWKGNKGYVQDFISNNYEDKVYILCGNPFMTDSTLKKLIKLGVAEKDIVFEKWQK